MAGTTMTWNQIGEPISLITWVERATSSHLAAAKSQKLQTIEEAIQIKDAICLRERVFSGWLHTGV